jgi:hypothetical protein
VLLNLDMLILEPYPKEVVSFEPYVRLGLYVPTMLTPQRNQGAPRNGYPGMPYPYMYGSVPMYGPRMPYMYPNRVSLACLVSPPDCGSWSSKALVSRLLHNAHFSQCLKVPLAVPPEAQRQQIGNALYAKAQMQYGAALAGRITGMLLTGPLYEAERMLMDENLLRERMAGALSMLQSYDNAPHAGQPIAV